MEQGVWADDEAEFSCEASARFPSDGKADQLQRRIQAHSLTGLISNDGKQSFAEDTLCAKAVLAAKAPRVKFRLDCDSVPRKISGMADVAAVDAR